MRRTMRIALVAFAVLAPAAPLTAGPIFFTDRGAFEAAHASLGLPALDLETFAAPSWEWDIASDSCTVAVPGLRIWHDCHDGAVAAPGTVDASGYTAFPLDRFGAGGPFEVPQVAVGFDYVTPPGTPWWGLTLAGSGFLGRIDPDDPMTYIGTTLPLFGAPPGQLQMDNLLLRRPEAASAALRVASAPEPATALLVGLGGLACLVRARRG